jgi:predicted aconitase with swiveling domain
MPEPLLKLKMLIEGEASGPLIFSREALSFWGGVDAQTGEVIDRRHPLSGQFLAGKILVLPGSRGSSSGSGVLLEAIRNRTAPAAIITAEPDHILALAALLGQELYARNPPVAVAPPDFFEWAAHQAGNIFSLRQDGSFISGELSDSDRP